MYSLVHLVIWYFIWVLWHFSRKCALHILWLMCVMLSMWYIFTYITITLAWPIMEDIESIDLGSGDRPREFEAVTHFTFWLEWYHTHIHTLAFSDLMTYPFWAWHDTTLWYYCTTLPSIVHLSILQYSCLSFPSFHGSDQVVSEMIWPEMSFTRW